jgi:beta-lactamase regulating signal transducer with metallopeptidase domain
MLLRESPGTVVFALWGIVAVFGVSRLFMGFVRIRRRIQTSQPAPQRMQSALSRVVEDLGCRRSIRLHFMPGLFTPFLSGFTRPIIVLPEQMMSDGDTNTLRAVLAHEVSHLCSGDLLWMCMARWLGALLWFHPLTWKLHDAHNRACEAVCDAVAADYIGNRELYSSVLARVALEIAGVTTAMGVIPLVRSSEIMTRLRMLKRTVCSRPLAAQWVVLSVLVGTAVFVCLGSVTLVYAKEDQTPMVAANTLPGFEGIDIAFSPRAGAQYWAI